MQPEVLERYFPILFGFSLVWLAGWVVASIAYRRSRGKPIVFRGVEGAAFIERGASGRSNATWYTKLGGATRVLVVAIAGDRLIIRPRFPFNLLFLPEIYGLEYDVPLRQITSIERAARTGHVRLEFHDQTTTLQDVTLELRRPDEFIMALQRNPR